MKDIKTFVIGFLSCVCMFLITGQTQAVNQVGRYQYMYNQNDIVKGKTLFNILDTKTGDRIEWFEKATPKKVFREVNRYYADPLPVKKWR